jgi:beta-lactamase class A
MPRRTLLDRRSFLGGTSLCLLSCAASTGRPPEQVPEAGARLAELERSVGGRLGVAYFDSGNGKQLNHRGDERFPMCSTFKLMLVAAVLERVDAGQESPERRIPTTQVRCSNMHR